MTGKDIEKLYKDAIKKRKAEAIRIARLVDKEKIGLFQFYEKRLEKAVKDGFIVEENYSGKPYTSWYFNDFIHIYVNKDIVTICANMSNRSYRFDTESFKLFHRYVAISTFLRRTKNYEDPGFYDNASKLRHYLED